MICISASDYGSLELMRLCLGGAQAIVIIDIPLNSEGWFTFGSNVTLKIPQGGFINVASGRFTVAGPCHIGRYTVFSGEVYFLPGSVESVYPEWWGLNGAALQSAVNSVASYGIPVQLCQNLTVSDRVTVSQPNVTIQSDSGGKFLSTPVIQYIGPEDDTLAMIYVQPTRAAFTLRNVVLDANLKAGICLHVDGNDGGATHRPEIDTVHFKGYRSRGVVLGKNSTSSLGSVQMQLARINNISFSGGVVGAIGFLHNAQNDEWCYVTGCYFDPTPGMEHSYHIYNRAGGMKISALLTTRSTVYAVYAYDSVNIDGWRAEERYIYDSVAARGGSPVTLRNVESRPSTYSPTDQTIRIKHVNTPVGLQDIRIKGSIWIGATDPKCVTALNVYFDTGGDFIFATPRNVTGIFHNAVTGAMQVCGPSAAIEFKDAAGNTL